MLVSRPSRGDLMSQVTNAGDLPLLSRTPDSWAGTVIKDVLALLNDHAYLETIGAETPVGPACPARMSPASCSRTHRSNGRSLFSESMT